MDVTPAEWQAIEEAFHELCDLPPESRDVQLARLSQTAPRVAHEVAALLAADLRTATPADSDLSGTAAAVLNGSGAGQIPQGRFGPYRALEILGEGGMGVVYLAEREDVGARVALKVLWDAPLSPRRRERFAEEQRILAGLRHPGIVPLYDAGVQDDGTAWFAMEHVEGQPLSQALLDTNWSLRARLQTFADICDAVSAAHRQLVVHGDIKPSNVLLDRAQRVRLLDFGVSGRLQVGSVASDQDGRMLTPAYAAPERRAGQSLSVQSDVYSLGVLLYQLVAGRLPLATHTTLPRSAARLDWDDLDLICLTARAAEPEARYASAEALKRDVQHWLERRPIEARRATTWYRLRKFGDRNRRGIAAVSVLLIAAALVGARLIQADRATQRETARVQRIERFMLNLLSGGENVAGPADSVRVTTLLESGVREAAMLADDPPAQAQLLLTLGTSFRVLGKLARADSVLRQASTVPGVSANAALRSALLAEQALIKSDGGVPDTALALAREAVSAASDVGGVTLARAWEAKGRVHEMAGAHDSASAALSRAVMFDVARGDTGTVAFAELLMHLSNEGFYQSLFDSADATSRRVLAFAPGRLPENHPKIGDAWLNLGATAKERGKFDEALQYTERGTEIISRWYGPNHHQTASAWAARGRALFALQRYDEAEALFRKALAVREQVFGPTHPRVASLLNEMANIEVVRDRDSLAVPLFQRVIDIYRATYGEDHDFVGLFRGNLASALTSVGRFEEAERELRAGLAVYAKTLPPGHLNVGIHHVKLGRALLGQGRLREARTAAERGLEIIAGQKVPQSAWMTAARRTLLSVSEKQGDTASVSRYRREIGDSLSR